MFKWLKKFFAVDNDVNEDTVMGVIFSIVLGVAVFTGADNEIVWTLAGMVLAFFGLGGLKKPGA